jgi:hypothetical protein
MTRFLTTALLTLSAFPAFAQQGCPTGDDLARGIRISFEDGGTEVYRSGAPGVQEVTGTEEDGSGFRMEIAQGTHLLSWEGTNGGVADPSSLLTYDYNGVAPENLPAPRPGKSFQTAVTATDSSGPRSEPQNQTYGPLSSIAIGTCTYDMIEVTIAYATTDNYVEMLRYLPELGIGYLLWNESDSMTRQPIEATAISAGK